MTTWFGYVGKLLRIDLAREKHTIEELSEDDAKLFLGGIGLAAKIVFNEVDPRIDPFDEDNKLVFMTGPLTGTLVPGASRTVVAAKSPLTLAWGESHFGGFWGPELKRAGYDGVIIEGKAKTPVYIFIHNENVEIRDAEHLWGLFTGDTEEKIRKEVGDEKTRVACIGPAGENLVRYAAILSDERVAGRTGMGAVMGSKNLKAIAVRGTGSIRIKEARQLRRNVARLYPMIMSYPPNQILSAYGTNGEMLSFYEYGDTPIKNFTMGTWEGIKRIEGKAIVSKYLKSHKACFACPVGCWKIVRIDEGKYAGTEGRAPEYETAGALGAMLLNDDPETLIYLEKLCNDYGIDTISAGVTLAWAMEIYERGLITKEDTGGIEIKWGDPETIVKLIEMIGRREGFGNVLAEGTRLASNIIGKGTEKYAMHVKGLEVPMHDPRAFKGMGLQYATSNRGACHLQGTFFRIEQGERIPDLKIYRRVYRFELKDKGWMVAVVEDWHEVLESLGLCKFVQIYPGHVAGFYSLTTGIVKRVRDLQKDGERIFNLKRVFNVIAGVSRKDDILPERFLKEPLKDGGAKGQIVELEPMLKEYYSYRKWNENGIPTEEKLEELGILDMVKQRCSQLGVKLYQ